MGIVNFGIPEKEANYLRKNLALDVFVEGGTYKGKTAKKMSVSFKKVYTIEKSNKLFNISDAHLQNCSNVTLLKGDTRDHLNDIITNNNNILFWLDAHWSGGITYGEKDECPLLEELNIIFKHNKNYVILIDDARLFLAPPPLPHNLENWPTINDIIKQLPHYWELFVFEDVIYIIPSKYLKQFKYFMQNVVTEQWKK